MLINEIGERLQMFINYASQEHHWNSLHMYTDTTNVKNSAPTEHVRDEVGKVLICVSYIPEGKGY